MRRDVLHVIHVLLFLWFRPGFLHRFCINALTYLSQLLMRIRGGGMIFSLTDGLVLILASLGSRAFVDLFYRNS